MKGVKVVVGAIANIEQIERILTMDQDLDLIAIKLVALDGHKMPLTGNNRAAAIKIMAEYEVTVEHMAWRLHMNPETLRKFAKYQKITLPKAVKPAHWTVAYVDRRDKARKHVRKSK